MEIIKQSILNLKILMICCLLGITSLSSAQTEIIPVWKNMIPGAVANDDYEEVALFKDGVAYNVSKVTTPTLSVFLPEKGALTRAAVIICPGGGYSHLAMDKEGTKVAKWLNSLGIAAFVLKYRLPSDLIMSDKTIGPLQDAQEAMRVVRRNAENWNLDVHKIGIMGFSAGGHLAATLSTHSNDKIYETIDSISARPDFSILIYPVISMKNEITHKGSQTDLLGENPSLSMIEKFSNELCVNAETPPTFLVHASDDHSVPVENSIAYYQALLRNNISAEMHVFERGGHGFGLGVRENSPKWTLICENWLRMKEYISN